MEGQSNLLTACKFRREITLICRAIFSLMHHTMRHYLIVVVITKQVNQFDKQMDVPDFLVSMLQFLNSFCVFTGN